MGVYNIIDTDMPCPYCGAKVDEWQSKRLYLRGYALANVMDKVTLEPEMSGEMHHACGECKTWIDVEIINGTLKAPKTHALQQR